MRQTTRKQAVSFAMIGAFGFLVDGGVLTVLNSAFQLDLFRSRLVSFSIAVTVTWALNRRRTFADRKDRRAAREWGRYAIVNALGALLNMAVFFWLVQHYAWAANQPILPLAIAASIALNFNFIASKYVAFWVPRS